MAKLSPLMVIPPLAFLALAAMFALGMKRENPDELPTELAGKVAPHVAVGSLGTLPQFDDNTLRDGKMKLVNFWASWCAPCRAEHPTLMQLQAEGLDIYGVNYKDQPDNALSFLGELGDPFTGVGVDSNGRMALSWGVYGVPETYLVNGEGQIILRVAGPLTQRQLTNRLRPYLDAGK